MNNLVLIFQAVTEPNFTYTGARLANYLDKNMNLEQKTKHKFRKVFMGRYFFICLKFCYFA